MPRKALYKHLYTIQSEHVIPELKASHWSTVHQLLMATAFVAELTATMFWHLLWLTKKKLANFYIL